MDYLWKVMEHPDVSGFELLEYLDVRSRVALQEPLLNQSERKRVEEIDQRFLRNAPRWLERILDVCDLAEMRHKSGSLPSHWWWYLDEIIHEGTKAYA
jgi:hypothetical protein